MSIRSVAIDKHARRAGRIERHPFARPALQQQDRFDRRAAETAELLAGALWQRAVLESHLRRAGVDSGPEMVEELRQLDEEITGLEAALRERPWTEAL